MNREELAIPLNLLISKRFSPGAACLSLTAYEDFVRGLQRCNIPSTLLHRTERHCIADELYCKFLCLCLTLGDHRFQTLSPCVLAGRIGGRGQNRLQGLSEGF